uniref:ELL-associated factor n=1 Tax=Solanum tuberosum TaxID=4113 RepID=M1D0G1_SOLTU
MANINNKDEPSTAPQPDRWYNLSLGSSFKDHQPSSKFCTLRYEFKPASIDKNQPGKLHKTKDNKISVEFQNNQPGKPKVSFDGSSEDYKENDAVLFFDGESFRLERLHRAVKRLRYNRLPGESAAAVAPAPAPGPSRSPAPSPIGMPVETRSPPVVKGAKFQSLNKPAVPAPAVPVSSLQTYFRFLLAYLAQYDILKFSCARLTVCLQFEEIAFLFSGERFQGS